MRTASIAFAAVCLFAGTAGAAVEYTLTGLGDLPGGIYSSQAHAINDLGEIVGGSHPGSNGHVFLWDRTNGMQDLHHLLPESFSSSGLAINNMGQIVVDTYTSTGFRAFRWDPASGLQDLGAFPCEDEFSGAFGGTQSGDYRT
jgi:probable HAF family extracellular repeat protein